MALASPEDYCLHAEDVPIESQNDLEDELKRMNMSSLIKLAAEAGATEDEIEQAHEGAREACIRLIKEKEDLDDSKQPQKENKLLRKKNAEKENEPLRKKNAAKEK